MITIIPLWKMLIDKEGKARGLAILATLPIFIATGALAFINGLQTGRIGSALVGLMGVIFFGLAAVILFTPTNKYIPRQSFIGYRSTQAKAQKSIKYAALTLPLLAIGLSLLMPSIYISIIAITTTALIIFYQISKSIKRHEDIDFSTNLYLVSSLGIDPGEKALASYQNFSTDNIRRGSNAFVATANKLVIASFNGKFWEKLSRDLNQITQIGIIADRTETHHIKLIFDDGTDAVLRIQLDNKSTSNPKLIIKRLLEVIDNKLLGENTAKTASISRQAITAEDTAPPKTSNPKTLEVARSIEIAQTILNDIKNAKEIMPGRKLEL